MDAAAPRHLIRPIFRAVAAAVLIATVPLALFAGPAHAASAPSSPMPVVSPSASPAVGTVGPGAYTHWTFPTGHYSERTNTTYSTGVTNTGEQRVYRTVGQRSDYTVVGQTRADDHNAPALSVEAGHPTLVFSVGHDENPMEVRSTRSMQSIKTGAASVFSEPQRPFTMRSSYAQVVRQGARVAVFTRYQTVDAIGWWYVTSSDDGRTWSAERQIFDSAADQSYLLVREDENEPGMLTLAAYLHPKYAETNRIGFTRLSFDALWAEQPVLTLGDLETVVEATQTFDKSGNGFLRLLDVTVARGLPRVLFGTWSASDATVFYRMATRSETGWASVNVGSSGRSFGAGNGNYVPAASFDTRAGRGIVYYGSWSPTAGTWSLTSVLFDGAGIVKGSGKTLARSSVPLSRPMEFSGRLFLVEMQRYDHYVNFDTTLRNLPLTR